MTGDSARGGASGLLVVLPAYNEARTIGGVVAGVLARLPAVLVVDDGSADETSVRARAAGAEVVRLEPNQGKGAAVAAGFAYACEHGYEGVITMDGDGQHSPDDLPRFVEAFGQGDYPVIIGNRMSDTAAMPPLRRWTNRWMSWLLSRTMGQSVPDTQNGYRLYRLGAVEGITLDATRFDAESEILLQAAARGLRIGSVPVQTIYGDEQSKIRPVRDTFRFFRMLRRFRREMRRARRERSGPGTG